MQVMTCSLHIVQIDAGCSVWLLLVMLVPQPKLSVCWSGELCKHTCEHCMCLLCHTSHPSCLVCCVWPLLCLSLRSCDKRMHHWLFELLLTCDAHDIPATVWHADLPEQRSGVAAVNSRKRSADDSQAARVSYKGKTVHAVHAYSW